MKFSSPYEAVGSHILAGFAFYPQFLRAVVEVKTEASLKRMIMIRHAMQHL